MDENIKKLNAVKDGEVQVKGYQSVYVSNWKGARLYINSTSGQRKVGWIDLATGEAHPTPSCTKWLDAAYDAILGE